MIRVSLHVWRNTTVVADFMRDFTEAAVPIQTNLSKQTCDGLQCSEGCSCLRSRAYCDVLYGQEVAPLVTECGMLSVPLDVTRYTLSGAWSVVSPAPTVASMLRVALRGNATVVEQFIEEFVRASVPLQTNLSSFTCAALACAEDGCSACNERRSQCAVLYGPDHGPALFCGRLLHVPQGVTRYTLTGVAAEPVRHVVRREMRTSIAWPGSRAAPVRKSFEDYLTLISSRVCPLTYDGISPSTATTAAELYTLAITTGTLPVLCTDATPYHHPILALMEFARLNGTCVPQCNPF